jgi:FixJ family two-component response regulator
MAAQSDPIVYVIDDDAQSGRAMAELVRTFGHQVRTFENPRDFLDNLDDIDPDQVGCVITDLRMSGLDGMEVLHRLLERSTALPVIIVTAYAETAVTVRAHPPGGSRGPRQAVPRRRAVELRSGSPGKERRRDQPKQPPTRAARAV